MVVDRFVYVLVKQQCPIECVQTDPIPTAYNDIPGHVIDASTLGATRSGKSRISWTDTYIDWSVGGKLPHKTLLIQVPKHDLTIRRGGQQCAERPGHRENGNGRAVAEKGSGRLQVDRFAARSKCPDGNSTVSPGSHQCS